ncbi:MAG: DUF1801 domain-containing protein [Bacteroidota bacterium]
MRPNKTIENDLSVSDYLERIQDETKRDDCLKLVDFFAKQSKYPAKMWGNAIIGFGSYHYVYESGREGDAPLAGLSARSNAIVLYLANAKEQADLLTKLGKHKLGGGCIYIKKYCEIDTKILALLIKNSISYLQKLYPTKK